MILYIGVAAGFNLYPASAPTFPKKPPFSYMWWLYSIKDSASAQIFGIKTSTYSLLFNYDRLCLEGIGILSKTPEKETILKESNKDSFKDLYGLGFRFGLEKQECFHPFSYSSGNPENCELIYTGTFYQKRFLNNIPELIEGDPYHSGLIISSWPDCFSMTFRIRPKDENVSLNPCMVYNIPSEFRLVKKHRDYLIYKKHNSEEGLLFEKINNEVKFELSAQGDTIMLRRTFPKHSETIYEIGCRITPTNNINPLIAGRLNQESSLLFDISNASTPHFIRYDTLDGSFNIELRDPEMVDQTAINNRFSRYECHITNPSERARQARIHYTINDPAGITGISAIICDGQGNPSGYPVQLSKNWHTRDFKGYEGHLFRGSWFSALSTFEVPPDTTLYFSLLIVNGYWGTLPAATHTQLCLVGWGTNQQWDQAAVGAWGENICYEPEKNQAHSAITDIRPLLSNKKAWTGNVGGADFLILKPEHKPVNHSRIRTDYRKYCPNLTEVTYYGILEDESIDFNYTTSLYRSDDMIRGIFRLRLDVLKNCKFTDFIIFQMGGALYHSVRSKKYAVGNKKGCLKTWEATMGGENRYIQTKQPLSGEIPWIAMFDSETSVDQGDLVISNRGIIVRKWEGYMNGKALRTPYYAEYSPLKGWGEDNSIINLTLPPEYKSLNKGDYLEAELEIILPPLKAEDYELSDSIYNRYLSENREPWTIVFQEAIQNNLSVTSPDEEIRSFYPVVIKAKKESLSFSIQGGMGYIPVSIDGIRSYKEKRLYRISENGVKEIVDQSVYGNDFWQNNINPDGSYCITYNLPPTRGLVCRYLYE